MFSANSLLSPLPLASGIRPGSESDLRMEGICKQLNITVLHGSNMLFWLLHPSSVRSYQKHLLFWVCWGWPLEEGMLYWETDLFLCKLPARSLQAHRTHRSKNRRNPSMHSYGFKNNSRHNSVSSCWEWAKHWQLTTGSNSTFSVASLAHYLVSGSVGATPALTHLTPCFG